MDKLRKLTCTAFLILLAVAAMKTNTYADMGPKPSIEIRLINPPQEYYYVDLLVYSGERKDVDPESPRHSEMRMQLEQEEQSGQDLKIKNALLDYEQDGWCPWLDSSPVGDCFHPQSEDAIYSFDYMVPKTFRVIVVTESGQFYTSNEVTVKLFNAVCTYDLQTGVLAEQKAPSILKRVLQVVLCYIVTLVIEGVLLLLFGLGSAKRNWKIFFLVNTITQLLLQLGLEYYALLNAKGLAYLLLLLLIEICIAVFESVCYAKRLWTKDGSTSKGRNVAYALIANFLSFFLGRIILLF